MRKKALLFNILFILLVVNIDVCAQGSTPVRIKVHTKEVIGKIKKVNGGNLAPPLTEETQPGCNIREAFSEMNIPITRLHDAPQENGALRLVDVPLIFCNMKANANNPDNYYFEQTDDYIRNCIESGTDVYYRLGTSIEHSVKKYFVHPPEDVKKWIDVVSNIIRHYTEGKWNGFHYNIEYWEIWNEPDLGKEMWTGTLAEFNEFYVQVSKELKKRFPLLKFGGPGHCIGEEVRVKDFFSICAKNKAPLDFYSYHLYPSDDKEVLEHPVMIRQWLDEFGYSDTEIHLNEWHYNPKGNDFWALDRYTQGELLKLSMGVEGAAFMNTIMIGWQDTPVDLGCYYTVTETRWGLFENRKPTKSYYGMKAFGELIRNDNRVRLTISDLSDGSRSLAGKDEKGNISVLTALWKSGPQELIFDVDDINDFSRLEVYMLDDTHDLEPVVKLEHVSGLLKIKAASDSSVILLKLLKD